MLAFDVAVYRRPQADTSAEASRDDHLPEPGQKDLIARWTVRAAPGCLGWIDNLVEQGRAEQRMGTGYPMLYVGETDAIIQAMQTEIEFTEEITEKLEACRGDETLLVEAWDLS